MKPLFTSVHVQLLVLSIVAGTLLGCGSWFAKRQVDRNSVQKTVNEVPITVENQPSDLCPRLLQGSRSAVTNNFLYVLDTTNQECIATKWQDLFGDGKLFPFRKEDSLVFEKKDNLVWNKEWDENHTYKQYYKGIPVEKSRVMLNLKKDKIVRLVGTFYPNLNIDTTGMISREEAARVVLRQRNIPDSLYNLILPQMLNFSSFGVLPSYNKIFYSFRFYFGPGKGTWIVNAVSGQFHSFVQPDWTHVCHKCISSTTEEVVCPVNNCSTAPSTAFHSDYLPLDVPTLYNNCQSIRIDSCFIGDTVYYRLSPRLVSPGEASLTVNDTINIFDASVSVAGNILLQEERFCSKDSITTKNAIAASLFYGMNLAKSYFNSRQIDNKKPHLIWAHMPSPEQNEAQYSAQDEIFLFGDGDNTNFNPPVSPDIVAHEYSHAVLSHVFNINRDSVHANQPQVKAIHEGVSDIFSVLARRHAYGTVDWTIGNQVAINPVNTFPRDLAQPENTQPPQALFYNDAAYNWSPNDDDIYNHAGIIVKWFYLISEGGTGANFSTDGITVQPMGINKAELVLIAGLQKLFTDTITVPDYDELCQATTLAANMLFPPIDGVCSPELIAVRDAWQAVGLNCWASISPPLCTACLPDATETDVCDNHLPYIQSVQISDNATGFTIAFQGWELNESQTHLCLVKNIEPELTTDLTEGLFLTVVTSESMSNLAFEGAVDPLSLLYSPDNNQVFGGGTIWYFTVSSFDLEEFESNAYYKLLFSGQDLAGNPLISMHEYPGANSTPPCIATNDLPYKDVDGNWGNYIYGDDKSFGFTYRCNLSAELDIVCNYTSSGSSVYFNINITSCAEEEVTWLAQMDYDGDGEIDQESVGDFMGTTFVYNSTNNAQAQLTLTNNITGEELVLNAYCNDIPVSDDCENAPPDFDDATFSQNPHYCLGESVCISYYVTDFSPIENVTCSVADATHTYQPGYYQIPNAPNNNGAYHWQSGTFCFTPTASDAAQGDMVVFLSATDLVAYWCQQTGHAACIVTNLCCPTGFDYPQFLEAVYDCDGNLYQPAEATVTALTNGCNLDFTLNGSTNHTLNHLGEGVYDITLAFNNQTYEITDAITVSGIYLEDNNLQITHTSQPSLAACSSDQCNGQISLTVTGGSGYYTYYWEDCFSDPEEMMMPCNGTFRDYLCTGTYTVTVVDDMTGCETVYSANVGLYYPPNAGVLSDNEFSVSPTIFSGSTTLTYRVGYDAQVSISMFNGQGVQVDTPISQEFRAEGQYNMTHIPPSGLPQGVYYYVLYVCEQYITRIAIKIS